MILGVSPERNVISTKAFTGTENKLTNKLLSKLKIRIDVEVFIHPQGRVLIFHIPSRNEGQLVKSTGSYHYPMRAGESLIEMDQGTLKRILSETEPDFSSQIIPDTNIFDFLDETSIEDFKQLWVRKSQRRDFLNIPIEQMLRDLGLVSDKGITFASLILMGKKQKIDQFLPDAEIIFEWRQSSKNVHYDFRQSWRAPFVLINDEIWKTIDSRNLQIPFQVGLFQFTIFAFDEKSVREAILNAVTHRDYTIKGRSVFVKASPEEFFIESPGGFLPGITPENIIYNSRWRSRLLAETLEKIGLVERSGQGIDDIFSKTIRDGKGLPDFFDTDEFSVRLKIPAQVKDKRFILFLEKISKEKQIIFSFNDIFALEKIRENKDIVNFEQKKRLLELGVIEKVGKGRGIKYILSHNYYALSGKPGVHTRLSGITREQKKMLILNHLKKNKKGYRHQFLDVFPDMKPTDVSNLLRELKIRGKIEHMGNGKTGYWKLVE